MNTDPRISSLVFRWQENHQRQGKPLSLGELCADCPELRDAVAGQIEALRSTEAFLGLPPSQTHPPQIFMRQPRMPRSRSLSILP